MNIKKLRQNNGWTQKQLSELLGVSVHTVQNWDQGIRSPDRRSIIAIKHLTTKTNQKEKEEIKKLRILNDYELGKLVEKEYVKEVLAGMAKLIFKYVPKKDLKNFSEEFEEGVKDIIN